MRDEKWRGNWQFPEIKDGMPTKWQWMVQGLENFQLGDFTDVGAFTYINAKYGVMIGDSVEIGSHCSIYSESTIDSRKGRVIIECGAKIGTHSTIMPGVTIGKNAVIGAYSFVRDNVPAGALAYGIPAKVVKK